MKAVGPDTVMPQGFEDSAVAPASLQDDSVFPDTKHRVTVSEPLFTMNAVSPTIAMPTMASRPGGVLVTQEVSEVPDQEHAVTVEGLGLF
jgi:hypothetical protein